MNLFLFANSVLNQTSDVYGYTIADILDSSESVKTCYDYLTDPVNQAGDIKVHIAAHAQELLGLTDEHDLIVSLQTVVYENKAGSGLRGFYRSSRHRNSERCKGLAITLLKSMDAFRSSNFFA